ncbi:MAG: hypothetical protein ABSF62_24135, partial [Bryobacteraceae bacterium]
MNARTCQLCGKPLSRFAVGSGGDFCSREHRNQYRLRLGMDRLMEANKVASLMRRRENAKQISAEFLLTDCNIAPRSYPPARIPAQSPSMNGFKPTPAGLFVPRLPKRSDRAAKLDCVRVALAAQPRSLPLAMSGGRGVVPPLPRSHKLSVQIPQSRKAIVRDRILKPDADPRAFGILRHPPLRVHIGSGNHKRYSITPVGAHSLKSSQRTHALPNHPVKGSELRVSASAGFRLPEPVRPAIELAKPGPVAMPFSKRPREVAPPARKIEAGPRHAGRRIAKCEMVYQPRTMGTGAAAFLWPGAIPSAACDLRNADGVVRCSTLRWNGADPLTPGFRPHEDGVGFSRSSASLIASRPGAASLESAQRLTLVAFEPQENTFEYAPRALHGSLMGGVPFGGPQTPRQKAAVAAPAAAPPLEEHFANGWTNWLGGVQDWKLDIAGVRTGSLALFGPSIELDDYDLEFLARIEHHSINWVYRAHDFNDYYQGTIAVVPGDGFTFSRTTVVGGAASPAVTLPIRPLSAAKPSPGGKTAITVRLRVRGGEFTLYMDGQAVDTWIDARFSV